MTNHYIRQGATGTADGSDWTNAWVTLPATLVRGDIYYIADGTYVAYSFNDVESSVSYIIIRKATIASHGTETGWISTYGDGVATFAAIEFTTGYWDFDGAIGGGYTSWKTGHGFEITGDPTGNQLIIFTNQPSWIQVSHTNAHFSDRLTNNHIVYGVNNGAAHSTNIKFDYCYLHEVWGCHFLIRYWEDFTLEYSFMERNYSTAAVHAESVSNWGGARHLIRYNRFCDIHGSGIYVNLNGTLDASEFYGNIFYATGTDYYGDDAKCGAPIQEGNTGAFCTNFKIYNNTVYNLPLNYSMCGYFLDAGCTGNVVYNNLYYNASWTLYLNCTNDYDWLIDTLEQGSYGAHTITGAHGDPFVDATNGDFNLKAHSVSGINCGTDPYNIDAAGNLRATWDRGALEYGGSPPSKFTMIMR